MHEGVGVAHKDRAGGHAQAGAYPGGRVGGHKLTQTLHQSPCSLRDNITSFSFLLLMLNYED